MDEFAVIRHYFQQGFKRTLDLTGGNDDCATLTIPAGYCQHLSIDTMVKGVHFTDDMPAYDIGFRALATAVSDLAAMGAKPLWFSLALTIPSIDQLWLQQFSAGMAELANALDIELIGGDTTRGPLTISVQVAGISPSTEFMTRSGANVDDLLCVTGVLGEAAGGLQQWSQATPDTYLRRRYTRPTPRCDFAQSLRRYASACIDISDGLLADAQHIADASQCRLLLDYHSLPISELCCRAFGRETAAAMALTGGDDYELCFTIDSEKLACLMNDELHSQDVPVHIIGKVMPGEGVIVERDGHKIDVKNKGFNHFYA